MRAGTDIVNLSSYFLMIGAQLWTPGPIPSWCPHRVYLLRSWAEIWPVPWSPLPCFSMGFFRFFPVWLIRPIWSSLLRYVSIWDSFLFCRMFLLTRSMILISMPPQGILSLVCCMADQIRSLMGIYCTCPRTWLSPLRPVLSYLNLFTVFLINMFLITSGGQSYSYKVTPLRN